MFNPNNVTAAANAHVPISANYPSTNYEEFLKAHELGLIDWKKTEYLRKVHPNGILPEGIPIYGVSTIGSVTGRNSSL